MGEGQGEGALSFCAEPRLYVIIPTIMLLYQLLTIIVFSALILLAVLAFIEPGPLKRRSRNRSGDGPVDDGPESQESEDNGG